MLYKYSHDDFRLAGDPIQTQSCTKQMSLTMSEFKRTLPNAVAGAATVMDDGCLVMTVVNGHSRVTVQARPEANRMVGSLSLPTIRVDRGFKGYTAKQAEAFIRKFDRAFLRMGGG